MRGLGLKRSAPHKLARRVSLALHPGVASVLASPLPDSCDLSQFEPPVLDQGQTGSCTAASTTAGVYIAFAAAGANLGFVPSQRELYASTRAYERALGVIPGQPLPPLTDSGAELADVYTCLATFGVKPMAEQVTSDGRFYDIEDASVNDEPSFADLEAAGQKLVVGPYGVNVDSSASDTLAAALIAGIPIGIATFVDTAFESLQPGQIAGAPNQQDQNGGGHALLFTGFRKASDGTRQFKVRNSWSVGWCDAGYCWSGPAFLSSCWELHPLAVVVGV